MVMAGLEAGPSVPWVRRVRRNGFLIGHRTRKRVVGMCLICDGFTHEEAHSGEFVRIAMYGFTMIAVGGSPTWTYTIGLLQSFGHPELVMTGLSPGDSADLITAVVELIREGAVFDAASPPLTVCSCTEVAFGDVHEEQWLQGRFDGWLGYYDWLGGELPEA